MGMVVTVPRFVMRFVMHEWLITLLLTPGLRLARQISRAFLEEQLSGTSTAVAPPRVFAIDAWLEMQWRLSVEAGRLPEARLLSRMEERLLWQEIITSEQDNQGAFTLLQPVLAAEQALQARFDERFPHRVTLLRALHEESDHGIHRVSRFERIEDTDEARNRPEWTAGIDATWLQTLGERGSLLRWIGNAV